MDIQSQERFDRLVKLDIKAFSEDDRDFLKARSIYLTEDQRRIFKDILIEEKETEETLNSLALLTRRELEAKALELGIENPHDMKKFPKNSDLIEAIENIA